MNMNELEDQDVYDAGIVIVDTSNCIPNDDIADDITLLKTIVHLSGNTN